ncbi:single-stranded DNA-binding protein [Membranihabitans marinus]|uniref:single-stranded DNA-binding protein n=1 Tax=Membranihabitans marinus TaxID=1227546 RepID=UPI001F26880E|nr:single-stranded DNA-binding protein [Membranihabitans marinus]
MKNVRNQVQLIGRLGKDPELIKTQSGKTKAVLNIAVNYFYTNAAGQKIENTQWFRVIGWGGVAELMGKRLEKGYEVMVQGKLNKSSYENKQGQTVYLFEILADHFLVLNRFKSKVTEPVEEGNL